MSALRFYTVDVFTQRRFNGAQIAVFPNTANLAPNLRQRIAAELNLPQSVFLAPSKDDGFDIATYSPRDELGFGSHTTVAAVCALEADKQLAANTGHGAQLNFHHKDGCYNATLTRPAGQGLGLPFVSMTLATDPIVENYVPPIAELADILDLKEEDIGSENYDCKLVSNMGLYLVVPVRSLEAVREARFNVEHWQHSSAPGTLADQILLISESTEQNSADFHLRLMGAQIGEQDDPPVGSSIPAFAAFLCAHQHLAKGTYCYTVERGLSNLRQSLLHVEMDHKGRDTLAVRIGGNGIIMSKGEMFTSHLKAVN